MIGEPWSEVLALILGILFGWGLVNLQRIFGMKAGPTELQVLLEQLWKTILEVRDQIGQRPFAEITRQISAIQGRLRPP